MKSKPLLVGIAVVGLTLVTAAAADSFVQNPTDRTRIEEALPAKALVTPAKARRLLIFTRNVNYGGHPSIAYANEAFTLMGRKTGAFETVVTDDPQVFQRDSLSRFDAVFFNNTVGNCFTNADLRENLLEFVVAGGGLMGVHGTTVAFTQWPGAIEDWPEFGFLIGARGANHKDSDEPMWLKLDDPSHPLMRVFGGQGFQYRDEFFRPQGTYSRDRVRVLLSMDTSKFDPKAGQPRGNCLRPDNDYAFAWVRNYGRGRVFYCTIAHNPYVFWDAKMLQFYLGALQFILGDLSVPTTPSAKLTPAVRAQERLGWRLGFTPGLNGGTLSDTLDNAARLGLAYVGGASSQLVSQDLPKPFDPQLTDLELSQVRLKLEQSGVRLITYRIGEMPRSEAEQRRLFEFGRKMGIETFIAAVPPESLDPLERLCREYRIGLALRSPASASPLRPEAMLKLCRNRNEYLGACGDTDDWNGTGVNPVRAARILEDRVLAVQIRTGRKLNLERFLAELRQLKVKPAMFGLELSDSAGVARARETVELFNQVTLKLSPETD